MKELLMLLNVDNFDKWMKSNSPDSSAVQVGEYQNALCQMMARYQLSHSRLVNV